MSFLNNRLRMHNRAPQVFNKDTVLKNVDPGNMEAQMMENLISHKPYFILVTSLVQVIMFFLYANAYACSLAPLKVGAPPLSPSAASQRLLLLAAVIDDQNGQQQRHDRENHH